TSAGSYLSSCKTIRLVMAAPLRTLVDDYSRYHQAFQLFLERSSEHQLSSLGCSSVGSGAGMTFMKAVEIHADMVYLDFKNFKDFKVFFFFLPRLTKTRIQSRYAKNLILPGGESGWGRLWRTYKAELCNADISQCITTGDIRTFLDSKGISYQKHTLPSHMDITECFTEGDEKGELLLDFLTEVMDFSKSASPELKAGVLELLRHPDCSKEVDGRIVFNNNLEAVVLDP
uniref:Histamine N-methyltransferase n=1 Tax=Astyanax mexicanus TaxID=7994 RepID=A0A3B1IBZ2_ASTMX